MSLYFLYYGGLMFEQIITITLNPCLDRTLYLDGFNTDEPNMVVREREEAGGKGINVSKVLTYLGIDNIAIALVGNENGGTLKSLINESKIKNEMIYCKGTVRENLTILAPDSQQIKINRNGNLSINGCLEKILNRIRKYSKNKSTLVLFCGSIPKSLTVSDYVEFIKEIKEIVNYIGIDSSQIRMSDYIDIKPFVMKPNLQELSFICGEVLVGPHDIEKAIKPLRNSVTHMLVSLGEKGMAYYVNDKIHYLLANKVKPISTVGAGDASLAGFVYALCQGFEETECIRYANAAGAHYITLDSKDKFSLTGMKDILNGKENALLNAY